MKVNSIRKIVKFKQYFVVKYNFYFLFSKYKGNDNTNKNQGKFTVQFFLSLFIFRFPSKNFKL